MIKLNYLNRFISPSKYFWMFSLPENTVLWVKDTVINWSLFWCFRFQRAQGFSERIIEKWEIARKLRSVSRRWGYLWDRKIRIRRHADSGEESEGQCHAAGMHAYCPQPHCCSGAQQHLTAAPRPLCPSVTEGCSQIGKKQKQKQTVNKM